MALSTDFPTIRLTGRERQVLGMMARGLIDKEMANDLGIGIATIRTFRKRLQFKLGTSGTHGHAPTVIVAGMRGLVDLQLLGEELLAVADERLSRTR